jgi:hypothetical protein
VGRLSYQVKTSRSNLTKTDREPRYTIERTREGFETDGNPLEAANLHLGPTSHINPFQDVIINSL